MRRVFAVVLTMLLCAAVGLTAVAAAADETRQPRASFSDIDGVTPMGTAIEDMADRGVIAGISSDTFDPDAPIAAGTYIRMLAKLRGLAEAAPTSGYSGPDAGYLQAALNAHWFDWDQIPPDNSLSSEAAISRELGANIIVTAFFGTVDYNWDVHEKISDFSEVSGRYYSGVLGGLTLGIFGQVPGTAFRPTASLTRGEACLWAFNAVSRQQDVPAATSSPGSTAAPPATAIPSAEPAVAVQGGVSQNGWLQVKGTQLCSEDGDPIVLHGMSSMGIQWYPQYTNLQSIQNTVGRGANIFRIAMYTEEGGYLSDKAKYTALVEQIVQNAVQADVYVIIDWHILSDGNPMTHLDEALVFFREMSAKYASTPNVIYEICNEPNGNITWAQNVKPYAEQVVAAIRENSPRGIILIGNPMWDQDVDIAAADPVAGTNLMYTLHFYAGTHHQELRDKATRALEMGAPIFVSEWGTSDASGSGGVFLDSSDQWLAYMKEHGISWCNWSLCDKNETSAALVPGTSADIQWTKQDLSESGQYVFAKFAAENPKPQPPEKPGIVPVTASEAAHLFRGLPGCDTVIRKGSEILSGEDTVATGCTIEAVDMQTGEVRRKSTIIVYGDVLGIGTINIAQLVRVAQAMTGETPLEGAYADAADFGGTGKIEITDLVTEAALLIKGGTLRCGFVSAAE